MATATRKTAAKAKAPAKKATKTAAPKAKVEAKVKELTAAQKADQEQIELLIAALETGDVSRVMGNLQVGPSKLAEDLVVEKAVISKFLHGKRVPTTRGKAGLALAAWYQAHKGDKALPPKEKAAPAKKAAAVKTPRTKAQAAAKKTAAPKKTKPSKAVTAKTATTEGDVF